MSDRPQQRLEDELKSAMKKRDRARVDTLRMLLTAVKNRRIEMGEDLSDDDFVAVVRRAVKQRRDAAELYREGGRPELAAKEEAEIETLDAFLPAQVDAETLRAAVADYVAREGLTGMAAMGQVMKAMREKFGASADPKTLSDVVRQELSG